MKLYKISKTCFVREKPRRGEKRKTQFAGVIYLGPTWLGKRVVVISKEDFKALVKSLRVAEGKLRDMKRINQ